MKKFLVIAGVVLALLVGGVFAYRQHIINALQDRVFEKLSDPDSAKVRNVRLFSNWTFERSGLCGEVNAKNRMGGYVGYKQFFVLGGSDRVFVDDFGGSDFEPDDKKTDYCPFGRSTQWWHLR